MLQSLLAILPIKSLQFILKMLMMQSCRRKHSICIRTHIIHSKRVQKDAARDLSIAKPKAMHIHKKIKVLETTEEEIDYMGSEYICPNCERDIPTKRGIELDQGRWWLWNDCEIAQWSLADKTVKNKNYREHENDCGQVIIEGKQLDNVYTREYFRNSVMAMRGQMLNTELQWPNTI